MQENIPFVTVTAHHMFSMYRVTLRVSVFAESWAGNQRPLLCEGKLHMHDCTSELVEHVRQVIHIPCCGQHL